MWKRALIYGAAIAAAAAIWTLIEYALGFHGENIETGQYTGYLGLLISIVGTILAIRAAKKVEAGEFTFGDGFKQGLATAAVASVLGAAFFYIYGTAINPDYQEAALALAESKLAGGEFTAREREAVMGPARAMSSPAAQAVSALIGGLIGGAVISAIAALFMRRKADPAQYS